jgi:hypothetical protein
MGRLACVAAVAILTAGCATTSTGPDPPGPEDLPEYKERTSPMNVIWNVAKAYQNMDAEAYLDCLAEEFIFFLSPDDLTDFPELPEFWDKAEEIAIHEAMFGEGADVLSVTLAFAHDTAVWYDGGNANPFDDLWTFREDIELRIVLPPDRTLHADAPVEFLFRVDPDDTGPGGEVLWEISKHWDIPVEGHGERSGGREHASWGRIKSLYR